MPDDPGPDGDELLVEVTDGVGRLTINRPERRNAMSWSVLTGMREQLAAWKHDPGVRVVVLTGSGDKAFCAGADLTGMAGDAGALELHESRGELARLFHDLWDLGKPTVARVRGYCLAGGFGLALSCDLVVASTAARFGIPEVKRSLVAAGGGLWRLPRKLPINLAMELTLTGDPIEPERAYHFGLVNELCEPGEALDRAFALAERIAANAPLAVRESRRILMQYEDLGLDECVNQSNAAIMTLGSTADFSEGLMAFIEKRAPEWKGR